MLKIDTWLRAFRKSDGGAIYFRYTTDSVDLRKADEDAAKLLALLDPGITYNSTLAIIITFYRMTAFNGDSTSPVRQFEGTPVAI